MMNFKCAALLTVVTLLLGGCATTASTQKDMSDYRAHMPRSILVLPPVNDSLDVKATYGVWSGVTVPVAEAGYYVFPMAVVDSMFKENGVHSGAEAQNIPAKKLQEIFGADAALYIRIKQYGSSYQVLQSVSTVAAEAKLVDLKTGTLLWSGSKTLSQSSNNGDGGLVSALLTAVIDQVSSSLSDHSHPLANQVNMIMYTPTPSQPGVGLLYGPRSPQFQQDVPQK
ncbi:DUF799 domain-containing protein [Acinetobacter rudis]|uniref:DUF799 family lipoprotein n=1 Tax=Acinetobacter rudis TaxID=632955 RepID=A0AAW8JCC8_9GAMM|nr:GNA1162 family protein [Acinetobacter rudis]MDQ8936602.1 DUF799 family lipoprotein [Acinetobacter rudis]MDQ8954354.1 DUF799 family lipoprotein [Acinetobacter rudis]MDQ9016922.1 DUF799 family lipoprotein [Acinetobacter rudis]